MSQSEIKRVDLQFFSNAEVGKNISLDGSNNPIAKRTRSRTKCTPVSKEKSSISTPTSKRATRSTNTPIYKSISSPERTPSPKKTRASTKISSTKKVGFTPRVRKVVKMSAKEGQVTPLKIIAKSESEDYSPAEDDVSETDSFCKQNTPQKEKLFYPSININRTPVTHGTPTLLNGDLTPKTRRLHNGDSPSTPRTRSTTRSRTIRNSSVTPSSRLAAIKEIPPTPYATRNKLKQKIQQKKIEDVEEDEFEESVSGDSEYELEDTPSDSDHEETNSDSDYKSTPAKRNRVSVLRKTEVSSPSTAYRITPNKKITHQNVVVLDSEKYFEKKSQKNITSDNVLSKLPLPELSQSDISALASKYYAKHKNEVNYLKAKYREQFNKWLLYLKDGFNLMFYGLGSKIEILKEFQIEKLSNSCVLRVNGYNSNFSINEMIRTLMKEVLQASHCPANINDALDLTIRKLEQSEYHVFIIINNIDGVALRGSKKQTILSKLSASPYVHIVATVDHINAPLLWGNNKMSCFNFIWLDVTTFNSYATEISYQKSMDIENLGTDSSLELLNKVYNWQDRRTKEVFELIVKDFMNNKNKKNFKGTLTSELLRLAARNLSISSKSALISTLKAFIEHDIIYIEHNYLRFLINPNILRSFYNQHFGK